MTNLNFVQDTSRSMPDNPWVGMRTYQLTPWPQSVELTYYDIGPEQDLKPGYVTEFAFENGSARYRLVKDIGGFGCDWECELLPGSTWSQPPAEALTL
jgi:hypothetical protein